MHVCAWQCFAACSACSCIRMQCAANYSAGQTMLPDGSPRRRVYIDITVFWCRLDLRLRENDASCVHEQRHAQRIGRSLDTHLAPSGDFVIFDAVSHQLTASVPRRPCRDVCVRAEPPNRFEADNLQRRKRGRVDHDEALA
jgi:hypothetical protein